MYKFRPRPRTQKILKNRLNKTENEYQNFLMAQKLGQGDFFGSKILDFGFEKVKFKLAPKTFYSPDFFVITEKEFQIHEVKGFWEDDARVKIKVFAEMFPWIRVMAVQKDKLKGWKFEEF